MGCLQATFHDPCDGALDLAEEVRKHLFHTSHLHHLDAFDWCDAFGAAWYEDAREAQFGSLRDTLFRTRHGSYLTSEANLACETTIHGYGDVRVAA